MSSSRFGRRQLLVGGAMAGGLLVGSRSARAGDVLTARRPTLRTGPSLTSGVQAGDVSDRGAALWGRADGAGRMWAELFADGRQYYGVVEAGVDALDVRLKNIAGATLFSTRLLAQH